MSEAPACSRCRFVRGFLMLAAPLVALMALWPDAGQLLAPHLPPPLVFGMVVPMVGVPMFVIRLVRWHRAGRP
jgi:hypothetical protein